MCLAENSEYCCRVGVASHTAFSVGKPPQFLHHHTTRSAHVRLSHWETLHLSSDGSFVATNRAGRQSARGVDSLLSSERCVPLLPLCTTYWRRVQCATRLLWQTSVPRTVGVGMLAWSDQMHVQCNSVLAVGFHWRAT